MSAIRNLLIANRGEIACRILRTAKAMGIRTIAIYSDADANAPHVKMADEAIHIGAAPVGESYLVIDKIIAAARESGADAIHPGYGFLSEQAAFANACAKAGLIFVGPSAKAIDLMGDKARAKRAMIKAGVPCVPGYQGESQTKKTLMAEAKAIGFPLMVKAAAGGGGRGMRLVSKAAELDAALSTAKSEAENAFGSVELILEKAIIQPRHVEIQIMGDMHGNVLHLGERDCSVQRRHQKVIEEAPCPVMSNELRAAMGDAAVAAAKAVDYVGAGTVEFLLGEDGEFYFLEMNTRLQVEHPVTEQVTGLDLVALQIRVAQGDPLGFGQDDVQIEGHSIEVRLYAEDPAQDFLPSSGPIYLWKRPTGPGIRVDDGIVTGGEISPFYDPMVAKVIATGATREEARLRLFTGLSKSALIGPANNRDFLIDALQRDTFINGSATTAFISEEYGDAGFDPRPTDVDWALAALISHLSARSAAADQALGVPWELLNWSSSPDLRSIYTIEHDEEVRRVSLSANTQNQYRVQIDDMDMHLDVLAFGDSQCVVSDQNRRRLVNYYIGKDGRFDIAGPARQFSWKLYIPGTDDDDGASGGRVIAPMHGKLIKLSVEPGDRVEKGQRLAIMEAMKMQHEILAGIAGEVKTILVGEDMQVGADDLILEIEPDLEAET